MRIANLDPVLARGSSNWELILKNAFLYLDVEYLKVYFFVVDN